MVSKLRKSLPFALALCLVAGAALAASFTNLLVVSGATTSFAAKVQASSVTSGTILSLVGPGNTTMTSGGAFIRANDGTNDVFTVGYNGHVAFLPTNGTATTVTNTGGSAISCTAGNGTGSCSDTRGVIRVTNAANTNPIVLTFGVGYSGSPVCVVSPQNLATAADFASGTIAPAITTNNTALTITPGANWAATAKIISYVCFQ